MRVYFTSEVPCALRLGGAIAGFCSRHEQFADISEGERVLAEFFPENAELMPLSFLLDGAFFEAPPSFCEVYRYGCGANVHIKRFSARRKGLKPLSQLRAGNTLATLYEDGGLQLCIECGNEFYAAPLPFSVTGCTLKELAGGILAAEGKTQGEEIYLALFSGAKPLFAGEVLSYSGGERIKTVRTFHDAPGHTAESVWNFSGGQLRLESYSVREREGFSAQALDERLIPFAFFQTVLARGEFAKYLSPALAPRAGEVARYLGSFTGVCVPPSVFYMAHGNVNAAGLVYPEKENLFRIRFFAAPLEQGKIANIVPVGEEGDDG